MEDVNLAYDSKEDAYQDLDNPDTWWQLLSFGNDSEDCIVCDFPIEPGMHYGMEDDSSANAHRWCVSVKS